eukprot:365938-Chlamydomonas_euryale.AAC.10
MPQAAGGVIACMVCREGLTAKQRRIQGRPCHHAHTCVARHHFHTRRIKKWCIPQEWNTTLPHENSLDHWGKALQQAPAT